jgi:hypothetical protein
VTGPRIARHSALAAATAILVLGTPSPASAQCAAPTYHGGLPLHIGECPEAIAGGAVAGAWALAVLTAGLWCAFACSRSRAETEADLAVIDEIFTQAVAEHPVRDDADDADHMDDVSGREPDPGATASTGCDADPRTVTRRPHEEP